MTRSIASTAVLGVSADYHDAAAAIVIDGELVAAAEEERFTRVKHDASIPLHAMQWCLAEAGVSPAELGSIAFYAKPLTTYERILATHAKVGPRGLGSLLPAVSTWSRSKLWVRERLIDALGGDVDRSLPITFVEHHQSHAASAFYASPFESAAVLTFDGVGEWATTSIGLGTGRQLRLLAQLDFPDSIGLLFSALTAFCGFEVNDGEYKLMGLAPYGEPRYADVLRERVVRAGADGSFRLDQRYFDYQAGRRMTRPALAALLDGPPQPQGSPPGQREADIARSAQVVVEDLVLGVARHAREVTGQPRACLAGGVALNCVANARLRREGPFDDLWIQPAAGDAGGAVGAAWWEWHQRRQQPRRSPAGSDAMAGAFLGPAFETEEIARWLTDLHVPFHRCDTLAEAASIAAGHLAEGAVVGWFQGRMEFGPRALGHRSILADPRDPGVVARLNLAIKGREGFRPFAPAVLAERATDWFELEEPSPYMLFTAPVASWHPGEAPTSAGIGFGDRLASVRSALPACTHVDGSARVQTVDGDNPELRAVLEAFEARTGCPVLVNTSFNRAGEPIVRTPADALRCFDGAGLDLLVLERCIVAAGARSSMAPLGAAR